MRFHAFRAGASRQRTARIPLDKRTEASAEASDSGGDYVSDENVAGLQAGRAGNSGVARIRQHGYQNGYRDGINHGRYDRMQGYRYNYKGDQWEDADGGYQHLDGFAWPLQECLSRRIRQRVPAGLWHVGPPPRLGRPS
jgi:hypothetical protein